MLANRLPFVFSKHREREPFTLLGDPKPRKNRKSEAMQRTLKLTITVEEMPDGINSAIIEPRGNDYMIAINNRLSQDEQAAAFLHECLHLWHGDCDNPKEADTIEAERRQELARLFRKSFVY